MPETSVSVIRIERHDVHRQFAWIPVSVLKTHPESWPAPPKHATEVRDGNGNLTGWQTTLLDEIKDSIEKWGRWFGRMDILLGNVKIEKKCPDCGHTHTCYEAQIVVYPGQKGSLSGDVSQFPEEDIAWAKEESARVWAAALEHPELMKAFFPSYVEGIEGAV